MDQRHDDVVAKADCASTRAALLWWLVGLAEADIRRSLTPTGPNLLRMGEAGSSGRLS